MNRNLLVREVSCTNIILVADLNFNMLILCIKDIELVNGMNIQDEYYTLIYIALISLILFVLIIHSLLFKKIRSEGRIVHNIVILIQIMVCFSILQNTMKFRIIYYLREIRKIWLAY